MTSKAPEDVALRRQQVAELTRKGRTAAQIGAVLGISDRSVVRHRRVAGCLVTEYHTPLTAAEIAEAERLLDEGCSYAETARTLGRGARTLREHFPGRGWDRQTMNEHLAVVRRCRVRMSRLEGVFIK